MDLRVHGTDGSKSAKSLTVAESAFGATFNEPLVHQAVVCYQAKARAGTRAQKNRSAVRGGGEKPWRQKGTGRARAGTIRSPLWRGGGKVFPAMPRDFSQKINKKMFRGAMRCIISELIRQERLVLVDELAIESHKTKQLLARLNGLTGNDVLIVVEKVDDNLKLATRNLPKVDTCSARTLDPVDLIGHEKVLITVAAIKQVEQVLQ
ncbi:MAG: 50S ribosomal protein L4 [Gammaproteobacteria bacterium]|nr:50S ribosomal protein L4 [Gammaproteobacteria bacterium]